MMGRTAWLAVVLLGLTFGFLGPTAVGQDRYNDNAATEGYEPNGYGYEDYGYEYEVNGYYETNEYTYFDEPGYYGDEFNEDEYGVYDDDYGWYATEQDNDWFQGWFAESGDWPEDVSEEEGWSSGWVDYDNGWY